MKKLLILVKKKPIRVCRNLNISYLDETSELKARYKALDERTSLEMAKKKIQDSIKYVSKEGCGKVHVGGYMRDKIVEYFNCVPENLGNQERIKFVTKKIKEISPYRDVLAFRFAVSMDADGERMIRKKGLDPEKILGDRLKKVMTKFQNRFHPGDRISYVYGLHHDTDNLHLHVILLGRTEKGRHVSFSSPIRGRKRRYHQEDQLGFCKDELARLEKNLLDRLSGDNTDMFNVRFHSIRNKENMVPSISGGLENQHLLAYQKLRIKYDNLIFLQDELTSRRSVNMNPLLFRLQVPRILRDMNTLLIKTNLQRRRRRIRKFFELKREYLRELKEFRICEEVRRLPPSIKYNQANLLEYFRSSGKYKGKDESLFLKLAKGVVENAQTAAWRRKNIRNRGLGRIYGV
ncbi:MAG TPA: hypothetical protein DET40_24495 [Lentisphaeria bacterium]|nr:MAG: hypothetical protein A2X45_23000 [Lentisphaerae bacterium GWF2_50_93]HCE46719.1 hypothetical protein [Lentisphaeria bacterium]